MSKSNARLVRNWMARWATTTLVVACALFADKSNAQDGTNVPPADPAVTNTKEEKQETKVTDPNELRIMEKQARADKEKKEAEQRVLAEKEAVRQAMEKGEKPLKKEEGPTEEEQKLKRQKEEEEAARKAAEPTGAEVTTPDAGTQ